MKKNKIDLKNKILKVGTKVFAKKGFFNATVEEIAKLSGISKGTVYLYFPDKETLYVEVIDNLFINALHHLENVRKMNLKALEKLNKIIIEWNIFLSKNRFCLPIISIENINFSQKIFKLMRKRIETRIIQIFSGIEEIIKEGVEKKELKDINIKFATLFFMEMVRMPILLSMIYKDEKIKPDEIVEIFLNGIKRR